LATDRIETARSAKQYTANAEYIGWLREIRRKRDRDNRPIPAMTEIDEQAKPAVAYVNWGRWVADCPCGCGGAELVEPDQPFMCASCWNRGGAWLPVAWPAERAQIERTLVERSDARTRNWHPRESVADLRHENRSHGLGG
jgi:hypothetical protein